MTATSPKTSVTVRIGGEDHAIRSNADPEHTRRCAELLEERIREVKAQSGLVENHRVVILAALSIADRYLEAIEDLESIKQETAARTERLSEKIESELGRTSSSASDPGPSHSGPS